MPNLDEIKWASTGGLKETPPVRIQESGYTTSTDDTTGTPEFPILQWDNYWRSKVYTNLDTILNGTKIAIGAQAGLINQGNNGIIISSKGTAVDDTTDGHIHICSDIASLDYTADDKWNFTGGKVNIEGVDIGASLFAVGSVQQSMLTEVQFQTEMGDQWVLMDGRSVVGSRYETITGNSNVPDATGAFIRAAGGNADSVGSIQSDATAKNGLGLSWSSSNVTTSTNTATWGDKKYGYTSSDSHSHNKGTMNITGAVEKISETYDRNGAAAGAFAKQGGYSASGTPSNTDNSNSGRFSFSAKDEWSGSTNVDGHNHNFEKDQLNTDQIAHSHTFNRNVLNSGQTWGEDVETRPINIALYYYIKIN